MREPKVSLDERFSPFVLESAKRRCVSIERFNNGVVPIAGVQRGEYGCYILPDTTKIYTKEGWEPVAAGLWMDWVEEDWGITEKVYKKLSVLERATLECNEQLDKWVAIEYYDLWLSQYEPEVYNKLWWEGGLANLSMSGIDRANEFCKKVIKKLRK